MRIGNKQPRLLSILVVLILVGGLLLSACGELGLNLSLDGGGSGDGGTVSNSALLPVLLVIVVVVAALALIGGRG